MSSKTITERGLTSFAAQSVDPEFEPEYFSLETRKIELLAYFKYCSEHNLLTTSGEQSRKMLIRKTFNNLGASGSDWQTAMRNWLLSKIDPDPTDQTLDNLWFDYLQQHRTVPDDKGLIYTELSVEAGYRKFLYEYLELAENYYDHLIITDQVKKALSKVFTGDQVVVQDAVQYYLDQLHNYQDTITMDSAVVISQNKTLIDAINQTDDHYVSIHKKFSDTFQILDAHQTAGAASDAYLSLFNVSDSASLKFSKTLTSDNVIFNDSVSLQQNMVVVDEIAFSDTVSFIVGAFHIQHDGVLIEDTALILVAKTFNDTYTIADSNYQGMVLFNGGTFGGYVFGA